jgi:hypothetical protein
MKRFRDQLQSEGVAVKKVGFISNAIGHQNLTTVGQEVQKPTEY